MDRQIDNIAKLTAELIELLGTCISSNHPFVPEYLRLKGRIENFMRTYRSPDVWISQDGKAVYIKHLTDSHIQNIIALIDRQVNEGQNFEPFEIERFGNLHKEQLKRRIQKCSNQSCTIQTTQTCD